MNLFCFMIICLLVLAASSAQAYIGPGIGAGVLSVVIGFIASIFLAFLALFWYPIKKLIKKIKTRKSQIDTE